MNYAGTGNEKAVAATDLNRTHVGLTVSFSPTTPPWYLAASAPSCVRTLG